MLNYGKKTIVLSLLCVVTGTTLSQEIFSLKSFTRYCKSSINSSAGKSQQFARFVHYVRWVDNHMTDEYDYQVVCDKNKNNAYFAIVDESRIIVLRKDKYVEINKDNRELTIVNNRKTGRRFYSSLRYNEEKNHYCLHYYLYSMPRITSWSMPTITTYSEETVRGNKTFKYVAKNTYQATSSNGEKIDVSETTEFWIDSNNLEMDSLICKVIQSYDDGKIVVITHKEFMSTTKSFDFCAFEKLLSIDNPIYKNYSRHDENNLPYSNRRTTNKEMNDKILDFPLINLTGDQTTINQQNGWVLLDFWQFGCPSCFAQFRKFAQENDSLGSTILEQNNVAILSIHPYSDNMEIIGQVGEKYKVTKYLHSAKGMNTQLEINGYPTYYLISPDKRIILKTNNLGDYYKVLQVINNYQ